MKVIVTGGGTAGHVTPLLAVVAELKKQSPSSSIRYIGQVNDPMRNLFKNNQDIEKQYSIFAGKWRRYHGLSTLRHISDIKTMLKNIRDAFYFAIGIVQSIIILIFWRPNVVFVKGGFVGLPVGLAAAILRIPIVTHDSDSVPGLTNRILSRFAKLLCVGLPVKYYFQYYQKAKLRYTGVPIRDDYFKVKPNDIIDFKSKLEIPDNTKILSIVGGSLGAIRLNDAILRDIENITSEDCYVLWVTGKRQYEAIKASLNSKQAKKIRLFSFTDNMHTILASSDLVISRAGATSIAELAALSKAAILVPNPFLVGGHQTKNAQALFNDQAIDLITEDQLQDDPHILNIHIKELITDRSRSKSLATNLHKLAVNDASLRIVKVIKEIEK